MFEFKIGDKVRVHDMYISSLYSHYYLLFGEDHLIFSPAYKGEILRITRDPDYLPVYHVKIRSFFNEEEYVRCYRYEDLKGSIEYTIRSRYDNVSFRDAIENHIGFMSEIHIKEPYDDYNILLDELCIQELYDDYNWDE